MIETSEVISLIEQLLYSNAENSIKSDKLSKLLKEYYRLSNKYNIKNERFENLISLFKDKIFLLDVDRCEHKLYSIPDNLDFKGGISNNDALNIIKTTIENTKNNLSIIVKQMGKDIKHTSLKGFCEIAQMSTLLPLEQMGIKVTKNDARSELGFPYNHKFGTATFKIKDESGVYDKTFLIDITYKQFFETINCNTGMYYKDKTPDPGYFANREFATILLENGFIELNEKTAVYYGLPFYKSSLDKNNVNKLCNINFYDVIINCKLDYAANYSELSGFNLNLKEATLNK